MKKRLLLFSSFSKAAVLTAVLLCSVNLTWGQVMQSSNYQMERDSINFGGGFSSSTNYQMESTGGELASGDSASSNFNLRAGYQQMKTDFYLALSAINDVVMEGSIAGVTGGVSNGSTSFNVATNNPSGYFAVINSSGAPAMVGELDEIDDYVPAGLVPDYNFTFNNGEAFFGFNAAGVDAAQSFRNNGSVCGISAGANSALNCWAGLGVNTWTVAERGSSNHPSGTATNLNFRVGVGANAGVTVGDYHATTTITALPL